MAGSILKRGGLTWRCFLFAVITNAHSIGLQGTKGETWSLFLEQSFRDCFLFSRDLFEAKLHSFSRFSAFFHLAPSRFNCKSDLTAMKVQNNEEGTRRTDHAARE